MQDTNDYDDEPATGYADEAFPVIVVDNARIKARVRGKVARWSHLAAIPEDVDTLLEFAERIHLKPEWLQKGAIEHFDVTEPKRRQAIAAGALSVTPRELALLIQDPRQLRFLKDKRQR